MENHLPQSVRRWHAGMAFALAFLLPFSTLAQAPVKVDALALAKTALQQSQLPDADGTLVRKLAEAVRALPTWAPFYPGAQLGMDSGREAPGQVQVGFLTRDTQEAVARFYLERLKVRGKPVDLREAGVRTLEVSNAAGDQITSVILQSRAGGGVSGTIRHEGGW